MQSILKDAWINKFVWNESKLVIVSKVMPKPKTREFDMKRYCILIRFATTSSNLGNRGK